MDLYTTSFLLPLALNGPLPSSTSPSSASEQAEQQHLDDLKRLALEVGTREGCLVTVSYVDSNGSSPNAKRVNVCVSGSYGQVMRARGAVLRDFPRRLTINIKLPRSDILDSPLSPSCALKPDVRSRLDAIATQTGAFLSVVNPEGSPNAGSASTSGEGGEERKRDSGGASSGGQRAHSREASGGGDRNVGPANGGGAGMGAFGLETERMCEIVIEGEAGSVEDAKVRVLVMLDELSGLHSEVCEIDHKLHSILASRKRHVIQTIQEETGTNIFFPPPVCGLAVPPQHPLPGGGPHLAPPTMHPHYMPNLYHPQNPQLMAGHHAPPPLGAGGYPVSPSMAHGSPYPPYHHPQQHHQGQQPYQMHPSYPQQAPHMPNNSYGRNAYPPQQQQGSPFPGSGYNAPMGMPTTVSPGGAGAGGSAGGAGGKGRNALNSIWITGEFFGVQRARDMLYQLSMHKVRSKCIISRDTPILPRKLDWMLTERLEEIKTIMADNGTFVAFPPIGSQASLISVFGDQRVTIERTIRSIMVLASQFYVASFWLLPISFDVLMPSATINPSQMQPTLQGIADSTGAEVVFKSNCFEVHGLEGQVRAAVGYVLELDVIKNFHHEIRFQLELANEHREFISGKKNGKINKIEKTANVKIKFETFNDYNFLITTSSLPASASPSSTGMSVGSTSAHAALHGLSLLQEELPAEVSFHVPEMYHKRIIGVGGKNIQRVMKKHGVYVKFANADEYAMLGGYTDNEDNVVARTPAKNSPNLEQLKQAVMELVSPKDKDFTVETVSIPRRYHRTLLGEKSIFIHDIEAKTNSVVRFPNPRDASDIVTIFGPESQVHIAAAMLLDHVPFEADLHVPFTPDLGRVVATQDFLQLVEKLKRDLQIAIIPPTRFNQGDDSLFKFRCQRSNIDFLGSARDALEEFLVARKVGVYPSNARATDDSFADAFPHFNSALLPSKYSAADEMAANPQGESLLSRRSRPLPSASEVKALFDSPNGYYAGENSNNGSSSYENGPGGGNRPSPLNLNNAGGMSLSSNASTGMPTPVTPSFDSRHQQQSSYAPQQQQMTDFWGQPQVSQMPPPQPFQPGHERSHSTALEPSNPPTKHGHHSHSISISTSHHNPHGYPTHSSKSPAPPTSSPSSAPAPPPASVLAPRAADDALKRTSDSMLAHKLQAIGGFGSGVGGNHHPRSISSHRAAQSLDMGNLSSLASMEERGRSSYYDSGPSSSPRDGDGGNASTTMRKSASPPGSSHGKFPQGGGKTIYESGASTSRKGSADIEYELAKVISAVQLQAL